MLFAAPESCLCTSTFRAAPRLAGTDRRAAPLVQTTALKKWSLRNKTGFQRDGEFLSKHLKRLEMYVRYNVTMRRVWILAFRKLSQRVTALNPRRRGRVWHNFVVTNCTYIIPCYYYFYDLSLYLIAEFIFWMCVDFFLVKYIGHTWTQNCNPSKYLWFLTFKQLFLKNS